MTVMIQILIFVKFYLYPIILGHLLLSLPLWHCCHSLDQLQWASDGHKAYTYCLLNSQLSPYFLFYRQIAYILFLLCCLIFLNVERCTSRTFMEEADIAASVREGRRNTMKMYLPSGRG